MGKLLPFLKPYKKQIALMLLLLFAQVMGTLYIPTLTASIVNNGIVAGNLSYVWKIGGFMLLVAVITAVTSVLGTYTSTYISTGLGRDIRSELFRKAQDFSANGRQYLRFDIFIFQCVNLVGYVLFFVGDTVRIGQRI